MLSLLGRNKMQHRRLPTPVSAVLLHFRLQLEKTARSHANCSIRQQCLCSSTEQFYDEK